jgi:glycosyltransferase involved in cell wall biosynthesis
MDLKDFVSVAICMHNGGRYIAAALESVFAQSYPHFEVVLVDDGSTDGSADEVQRRFRGERLTIVRQPQQTLRVARPVAVAHARGDLIAFLDHDDVWAPDKLARQVELARESGAALLFSDCLAIDAEGRTIGRLSDQFDLASIDLRHGHRELLRRGNFVAYSTAMVRADAIRAAGGFDGRYQYVSDYDLWLRLARRYALACTPEPLAGYRIHPSQFTQKNADITLAEHCALLDPITKTASYPRDIRVAVGDMVLGQHRLAFRHLHRQRRYGAALRAALGMLRYPTRMRDYVRHRVVPRPLESATSALRHLVHRVRRLLRRWRTGTTTQIWFDGTALGAVHNGYFNLAAELIRRLVSRGVLHVTTGEAGRAALEQRIGGVVSQIRFHGVEERRRPRGRAPSNRTFEVLFWRGTFRWRDSHRIAIVQDLTTKVHPEWHTSANVREFDDYLRYVERHAHTIATISEHSRRDIVDRVQVDPENVSIFPMPIHPQYRNPSFDRAAAYPEPYVLCVGTIEPRKNLRRLVAAFEQVAADHVLVLAGPEGWDSEFLHEHRSARVRYLGFVELERLPSLYHFASAVIYPSLYEGFGLPLFEAMCSSAIVLASSTTSMPEVVGDDALMFDPCRTEEIAAALRRALRMTPDAAAAYRLQCRRRAEELLRRLDEEAPLPGIA